MKHGSRYEARSATSGHRFSLLFVFLLATLIPCRYAEASPFGYYCFRVIARFAILVSVCAAKIHRNLLVLAKALAIAS